METLYVGLASNPKMYGILEGDRAEYLLEYNSGKARLGFTRSNFGRMYWFDEYNIEYPANSTGYGIKASRSIWGSLCMGFGCQPGENYGVYDRYYRVEANVIPIGKANFDIHSEMFVPAYAHGQVRVSSLIFRERVFLENFIDDVYNKPLSDCDAAQISKHLPNFPIMPWADTSWTNGV